VSLELTGIAEDVQPNQDPRLGRVPNGLALTDRTCREPDQSAGYQQRRGVGNRDPVQETRITDLYPSSSRLVCLGRFPIAERPGLQD